MTGLECLKAELIKKGFTRSQADSKVVTGVLDVIANSNGEFTDLKKTQEEINALERKKETLEDKIRWLTDAKNTVIASINKLSRDKYEPIINYINDFYAALAKCETPDARDRLKLAQMFVNSVSVDTKYDNTAMIIGLASIISPGEMAAVNELHKINKRIPAIKVRSADGGVVYGEADTELGFISKI